MFRLLEKYRNSPAHKYINSPQLEEDLKEAAKKMTNKEAIAEFKERLAITDYKELIPEYYEAMELAIKALEKQIPKKPKEYEDKYYACPVCGNALLHKWEKYPTKLMSKNNGLPYCLNCGQAIAWEE